jgi:branched-chain amino acid transport system ATP-binding protein
MVADLLLAAEDLTRRFGGLAANRDVSLSLVRGEVHALLGPNGAGKSTCINLLSGDLAVTSGRVLLRGEDVTMWPNHRRSLAGIGRSYQRTNIFANFTVFENCRLAAQSRDARGWSILSNAHGNAPLRDRARAALEQTGLDTRADVVAATLSHGEQRQLEIAMVLATGAEVLLLDEPLAGMGSEESARMIELLKRLRPAHAILLVEHDMDAVFEVADRVTVMVEGRVLESGLPAQIRASAAVREAYLGEPA